MRCGPLTPKVLNVRPRQQSHESGSRPLPAPTPYNPLEKAELARSVEAALLNTRSQRLSEVPEFLGAGIYVLYYEGPHELYQAIAGTAIPIYVGKAVPRGARKARTDARAVGNELWDRIDEHRESTLYARDLRPADFRVRYLVTDELFIPLAERLMIRSFMPVWNVVVDGFGNHDPGGGRYDQKVSPWDTLRLGRPWVERLRKPCKFTREEIVNKVRTHFDTSPRVDAEATLPPVPPEASALLETQGLFDVPGEDSDYLDEESEE